MMLEQAQLADVVRHRLASVNESAVKVDVMTGGAYGFPPLRVTVRSPAAYVPPGIPELVLCEAPDEQREFLQLRDALPPGEVFGARWGLLEYASHTLLHGRDVALEFNVDICQRWTLTYDHGGAWKRHPPSKRRHMRSWRRAPLEERVRYAPLRGMSHVPSWAHHPDAGRYDRLGAVRVVTVQRVYAEPGLDVVALAKPSAHERMRRMKDALWGR